MNSTRTFAIAALLCAALTAAPAMAQPTAWMPVGPPFDWTGGPMNWTAPVGEPGPANDAHVNAGLGPGLQVDITMAGEVCSHLYVGQIAPPIGPAGPGHVNMLGGDLTTMTGESIGFDLFGQFDQMGGLHTASAGMTLGELVGGAGLYNLMAGQFDVGSAGSPADLILGDGGHGDLFQTDGLCRVYGNVTIGATPNGGDGTYALDGPAGTTTLSVGGSINVNRGHLQWLGGAIDLNAGGALNLTGQSALTVGVGFDGGSNVDMSDLIAGDYFVSPGTGGITGLDQATFEIANGKSAIHTDPGTVSLGRLQISGNANFLINSPASSLVVKDLVQVVDGTLAWYAGTMDFAPAAGTGTLEMFSSGTLAMGVDFDPVDLVAGNEFATPGSGVVTGLDQATLWVSSNATATHDNGQFTVGDLEVGGGHWSGLYRLSGAAGTSTLSVNNDVAVASNGRFEWLGGAVDFVNPGSALDVDGVLTIGRGFEGGALNRFDLVTLRLGGYFVTPGNATITGLDDATLEITNGTSCYVMTDPPLWESIGTLKVGTAQGSGTFSMCAGNGMLTLELDRLVLGSGGLGGTGHLDYALGTLIVNDSITINSDGRARLYDNWSTSADGTIDGGELLMSYYRLTLTDATWTVGSTLSASQLVLDGIGGTDFTQTDGTVALDDLIVNMGAYDLQGGNLDPETITNYDLIGQTGGVIGSVTAVRAFDNYGDYDHDGGVCNVATFNNSSTSYHLSGTGEMNAGIIENYGTFTVAGGTLGSAAPVGELDNIGDLDVTGGTSNVDELYNYHLMSQSGGVCNVGYLANDDGICTVSGSADLNAGLVDNYSIFVQTGGTIDVGDTFYNWYSDWHGGGSLTADTYNNSYYEEPYGVAGPVGGAGDPGGEGTYVTGTAVFTATTVNNGGYFEQTGGTVDVGTFNNHGVPEYYQDYGLFIMHGSFNAVTVNNYGYTEQSGGTLTADVVNNLQPIGEYGYDPGGGAQPYTYGIYVTGTADFRADAVHNWTSFWQDDGTVSDSAGGEGVFTNYPYAYVYLGIGPSEGYYPAGGDDPAGGDAGTGGGVFKDHLINYGYVQYHDGDFQGTYEHRTSWDGFWHAKAFTAEDGIINWGEMENQPFVDITANGPGLHNYGEFQMHGGELGGTQIVNEAIGDLWTDYHAVITTGLTNYGYVGTDDVLTVTGHTDNYGTIELYLGQYLDPAGGLDNYGTIALDGGVVTGTGAVVNKPGGYIAMWQHGAVTAPLANEGYLEAEGGWYGVCLVEELVSNTGVVHVEGARLNVVSGFTNDGLIELADGDLIGGDIANNGTLRGSGVVGNNVANSGVIRSMPEENDGVTSHGTLYLNGPTNTNGLLGRIEVDDLSAILFVEGLAANDGRISLAGGTFDNNGRTLTNSATGRITGHGTLRSGTITNAGHVGVGVGDMDVFAPVVHSGIVSIQGGAEVVFYDDVTGPGNFIGTGTAVFLGRYSPGSSPSAIGFEGDLVFGGSSSVLMEIGGMTPGSEHDQLNVAGQAVLNGTMDVALLGAYFPLPMDRFEVITHGSRSGEFATVTGLDDLAGYAGLDFALIYEAGAVVLEAAAVPGDANLDAKVNVFDLAILANNYNLTGTDWLEADFNRDSVVNVFDLAALANNYGHGTGGNEPVPEPAALAVLALGALAVVRRRRGH